jgi:GT2 family glycosyltransferase
MASSVSRPAPTVSVILCTKDRPADVVRSIASIRAADEVGRRAEIVVVEEADAPRAIPDVRYIHVPRKGLGFGHARNVGVRAAQGEILLFIDDDCEAEHGWAEALTAPFREDARVLGVAGAVLVRNCSAVGYAENVLGFPGGGLRYLHEAQGQVVPTRYVSTCNCAYRRQAVLEAGGFSEQARLGGEDFLLAERISALGRCVYTPHAVVYHRPRGTLASVFRWFVRRGQSEVGVWPLVAERARFSWYLIHSSWTLRVLVLAPAMVSWPWLMIWLPAVAGVYGGVVLWRFRFARRYLNHRRAWWLVPLVKLVMDAGTETGRWKAFILPGRR